MANIVTIQTPTYAVRETLRNVLRAFGGLTDDEQNTVFQAARLSSSLDNMVDIRVPTQAEGEGLIRLIRASQPGQTVPVASHTKYGKSYDVVYSGGAAQSCTCPDFENRSKSNPDHICKHMAQVNARPSWFGITS